MAKYKLPNNKAAGKAGLNLSIWYADKEYLPLELDEIKLPNKTTSKSTKHSSINIKSCNKKPRAASSCKFKKHIANLVYNLTNNPTTAEIYFCKKLNNLGYFIANKAPNKQTKTFEFQYPIYDMNKYVIVDFYFPRNNLVIELDGMCHFTRKKIKTDSIRNKWLLTKRISTVRLTNYQAYKLTLAEIQSIINNKKVNIDISITEKRPVALNKQPYINASRIDSTKLGTSHWSKGICSAVNLENTAKM